MARFEIKIKIKKSAAKEIESISTKKDRQRVVGRIRKLGSDPRPPGSLRLSGRRDLYRVRQGRYRILYSIEDDHLIIFVIKVGSRKDIYRALS